MIFSSDFDCRKVNPIIYIKFWSQACLPSLLYGSELFTLKLHKSPNKHRFIADSTQQIYIYIYIYKDLSCLLTMLLSTVKNGLARYCNTETSRNGVNNMWILKNATSLLSSFDQLGVRTSTSVQSFKLYTSIPHNLC